MSAYFLEIFAGTARISAAAADLGLNVAPPIEIANSIAFDVTNKAVEKVLAAAIVAKRFWAIWFAPPCKFWSRARSTGNEKDIAKKTVVYVTLRLLKACIASGTYFAIENPWGSALWKFPAMERFLKDYTKIRIVFCAFGTPYQKATALYGNLPSLGSLARPCTCAAPHEHLQGSVRIIVDGSAKHFWKTELAGRYPPNFARAVARLLRDACPSTGNFHRFHDLLRQLGEACAVSVAMPALHCPRSYVCEWDGARMYYANSSRRRRQQFIRNRRRPMKRVSVKRLSKIRAEAAASKWKKAKRSASTWRAKCPCGIVQYFVKGKPEENKQAKPCRGCGKQRRVATTR